MDAAALLEAIRKRPAEDTPRLIYADWLEEHGSTDKDRATVEFIRLSCDMAKPKPVMPTAAYRWLDANWQRLVPATLALHVPFEPGSRIRLAGGAVAYANGGPLPPVDRNGRNTWLRINLKGQYPRRAGGGERIYSCSLALTCWKGFVVGGEMYSDWGYGIVGPVLAAEQPLAVESKGPFKGQLVRFKTPRAK